MASATPVISGVVSKPSSALKIASAASKPSAQVFLAPIPYSILPAARQALHNVAPTALTTLAGVPAVRSLTAAEYKATSLDPKSGPLTKVFTAYWAAELSAAAAPASSSTP